jgi:biofilm PGA synthesis N-glycosyltransferase PgaC
MPLIQIIVLILLLLALGALFYIYVGYALLMIVLARFWPKPDPPESYHPQVTIIIPAFNEEAVIADKLDAVLALDYPRELQQIIVADDGSEDATAEIVQRYVDRGIELVSQSPRKGKITAMNNALSHVEGEITVFTDADITCPPDSLKLLVRHFADPTVGCVTSGHRIIKDASSAGRANDFYWNFESLLKASESRIYSTVAASGHMLAVRTELVEMIPPDILIDDFYRVMTILRQRYRVVYEPRVVCLQRPTISMQDEITRRKRMTAGRYQVMAMSGEFLPRFKPLVRLQVISHKFSRPFIPLLMIAAFVLNGLYVALPQSPALPVILHQLIWGLFALQAAFYLSALAGYVLEKLGVNNRLLSIPYYLVSANLGGLKGVFWYLSGERTVLWHQARRE